MFTRAVPPAGKFPSSRREEHEELDGSENSLYPVRQSGAAFPDRLPVNIEPPYLPPLDADLLLQDLPSIAGESVPETNAALPLEPPIVAVVFEDLADADVLIPEPAESCVQADNVPEASLTGRPQAAGPEAQ